MRLSAGERYKIVCTLCGTIVIGMYFVHRIKCEIVLLIMISQIRLLEFTLFYFLYELKKLLCAPRNNINSVHINILCTYI